MSGFFCDGLVWTEGLTVEVNPSGVVWGSVGVVWTGYNSILSALRASTKTTQHLKTVILLLSQHKLNTPILYNLFSLIKGVKKRTVISEKVKRRL